MPRGWAGAVVGGGYRRLVEQSVEVDGQTWIIGDRIGGGGFGQVFEAASGEDRAAVKFVPKAPGAQRELLFVDLRGVANMVPVIASGETNTHWFLVMPRAEMSLGQHLDDDGPLAVPEVVAVLRDIATALVDLEARGVVHRDLKPPNVLRLDGRWCLADFGISRYAEATTAPDTHKYAMTPPYAAPERWRAERATIAADVYAFGVMAYEMLSGELPFPGPTWEAYREQHLHADPPSLTAVGAAFAALVDECLYKAPGARPGPVNLLARLDRVTSPPASPGLAALQLANRSEVLRRGGEARRESEARTIQESREQLANTGARSYAAIGDALRQALMDAAPAARAGSQPGGGWTLTLHEAVLTFTGQRRSSSRLRAFDRDSAIDVVAHGQMGVTMRSGHYQGRSHCLWYCDAQEEGRFQWFELAFMEMALVGRGARPVDPFALDPGTQAAEALATVVTTNQLAWPFTPLVVGDLDDFIGRWAAWFALAADGRLQHPHVMPERPTQGSYRA